MALEVTPLFVSAAEAAKELGVTPVTIRRMVDAGELLGERFRRNYFVARAEIERRREAVARLIESQA